MTEELPEEYTEIEEADAPLGPLPILPEGLPQDERYYTLFATAIRKCLSYKPKFGTGRGEGLEVREFKAVYQADPFYSWIGLDSPLNVCRQQFFFSRLKSTVMLNVVMKKIDG